MFFWNMFLNRPIAALSIFCCLITIYSCIHLKRRSPIHPADTFLVGFVGCVAIYQGLRIVAEVGLFNPFGSLLSDTVEFAVAVLLFQAPMILRKSSEDRTVAEFELASARASAAILLHSTESICDSADSRGMREGLADAFSQLSDPAFKLYAYTFLRQDALNPPCMINANQLRRLRGIANRELESYLRTRAKTKRGIAPQDTEEWEKAGGLV
jgi:hypothetical protein